MILPIKDPKERLVGVLEIVGYQHLEWGLADRYLADFLSYCAGILIDQFILEERES